jgi:hypothetical protein
MEGTCCREGPPCCLSIIVLGQVVDKEWMPESSTAGPGETAIGYLEA